jgi:hypothetical protein
VGLGAKRVRTQFGLLVGIDVIVSGERVTALDSLKSVPRTPMQSMASVKAIGWFPFTTYDLSAGVSQKISIQLLICASYSA